MMESSSPQASTAQTTASSPGGEGARDLVSKIRGEELDAALARAPKKGMAISASAAAYARTKLEKRGSTDAAIRLGIKGGGCSGFSYVIQYEDKPPRARDYAYEKDGIVFYVDKKSLVYLAGSVLDYEKTLMFQGFKFVNPHEATSCGCGHSFTVK
ncbi:MAG: iron-sulfur cluster assembly accessory protein [Polyangiaceae bacterium]|nr:iron-sulfur cluster assembly accessory protein [Polyangiaceae bacterium]